MIDEALAASTIEVALRTGGDFAEVFVEDKRSSSGHLDDGRIEELSSGRTRGAGIRVVMITGDYAETARAVAERAGFSHIDIVTGAELDALDDEALGERVRTANVYVRVIPEQKLRVVRALEAGGDVVAMTGDGVNDAPALKAAHIGVAMGGRGTDVAREASALVLTNDDFASLVAAVRLGRRIYANLEKAMAYVLAVHVPALAGAVAAVVHGVHDQGVGAGIDVQLKIQGQAVAVA